MGIFIRDKTRGNITLAELRVINHMPQELPVMRQSFDHIPVKPCPQMIQRRITGCAVTNNLGNHRIIIDRNLTGFVNTAINADTGHIFRFPITGELANRWQESSRWVFGIKPDFHRPAFRGNSILFERQFFASGNTNHPFHQINIINQLSHRMFHLQAGIHFQKIKILIRANNKLNRASRLILHRFSQLNGLLTHGGACFVADKRAWGFFQHFLMAPL